MTTTNKLSIFRFFMFSNDDIKVLQITRESMRRRRWKVDGSNIKKKALSMGFKNTRIRNNSDMIGWAKGRVLREKARRFKGYGCVS